MLILNRVSMADFRIKGEPAQTGRPRLLVLADERWLNRDHGRAVFPTRLIERFLTSRTIGITKLATQGSASTGHFSERLGNADLR